MSEYDENPDRAIGDRIAAAEQVEDAAIGEESVDVSAEVSAEDFDWAAWLEGARPTRRSVRLNVRGDLVATMEAAVQRYEAGDDTALTAYQAAKAEFDASYRWFTVEARGDDAVVALHREGARAAGHDPDSLDDDEAAKVAAILYRVADQVVVPAGVTVDALRRLEEVAPRELDKLIAAATVANNQSATSSKVAGADFSLRR